MVRASRYARKKEIRKYHTRPLVGACRVAFLGAGASGYLPVMKTKADIVRDWLPRYTGRPLDQFGQYVLLTNFTNYVELFAERFGVPVLGRDRPMQSATAENITILNFGMGSAMAAT